MCFIPLSKLLNELLRDRCTACPINSAGNDGCILPSKAEHNKEMHPRCCLPTGDRSPPRQPAAEEHPPPSVARVLCKWTNIAKGWRPRFLSCFMIPRRPTTRLIGAPLGFLHLKVRRPSVSQLFSCFCFSLSCLARLNVCNFLKLMP
jgi:hypothetical protein